MKKTVNTFKLIVFIFLLFAIACNTGSFYSKTLDMEGTWKRSDTVVFCVNIPDAGHHFNFYIDIRNNTDYRYSNLYVFLHSEFPNGNITHDTLEFILAKKDGEWIGKGMGNVKENNILIRPNLIFPDTGTYCFTMEQAMRVEELQGIEDIGIRIEKAEQK